MTLMRISMEAVLRAAGIRSWEDPIEVLRDGFPSYVLRVRSAAFPARQTVILKACPDGSREPDVLLNLHRSRIPVPAVLDLREGNGFRVIVMEDVGADALHKHPDAGWYKAAVREIAKIHGESGLFHLLGGPCAALTNLVSTCDDAKWAETVRKGLEGSLHRLEDGAYGGLSKRKKERLPGILTGLAEKTLAIVLDSSAYRPFSHMLVHGDYHDGNILIRTPKSGEIVAPPPPEPRGELETMVRALEGLLGGGVVSPPNPFAIVDWDSARWDSGFFDLVSLYDVGERMGTFHLTPEETINTYLLEMLPDDLRVCGAETEWHRCCILRAWDELRWFSETGKDFGNRASREVGIIRSHLRWFGRTFQSSRP